MHNNINIRIKPNYGKVEGTNMTFSQNKKEVVNLEYIESTIFNEEKIKQRTKSSQYSNSKNFSEFGTLPYESILLNQKMSYNNKDIQGKIKEQGGNISGSVQGYRNALNQIQQKDKKNPKDKQESPSEQKYEQTIPLKPSIYIERERKLDLKSKQQLPISSSSYRSSSSIQSSQKKQNNHGQTTYNTQRLEDIEDIENYDSTNNIDSGGTQQLKRLREKDYFDDTENVQSFDHELNNRLKMMEAKKKLMGNTSVITSNYQSTINQHKLNYNDSVNNSISNSLVSQQNNQLEFSNSKVNLPYNNTTNNNENILGSKNSENLQNNSLYKELIGKNNLQQDRFSQQQQKNTIQNFWQEHVNQNQSQQQHQQHQLNISEMSTQQKQLQQNHIQKQLCNLGIDDSSIHKEQNQSSILSTFRLEQTELAIQQNNQKSILGINSRFQNSTLHSRYSMLEQDQSHNITNKSFDNSEKKNISRTIYNNSQNNPNSVAKFIDQGQANSHKTYYNQQINNINVHNILHENLKNGKHDYTPNERSNVNLSNQNENLTFTKERNQSFKELNQQNKQLQQQNIDDIKNNFFDDHSIIHKKGQSLEDNDYSNNENNEISHISALDHIKNNEEQDDENNHKQFQKKYLYKNNHYDDQTIQQENTYQVDEDNIKHIQIVISNNEIMSNIQDQQKNPFLKNNSLLSQNFLKKCTQNQNINSQGQTLGVKQIGNINNEQQIINNLPINNFNDTNTIQQKYVTLSQSFEEPNLCIEQQTEIQNDNIQKYGFQYLDKQQKNQYPQNNQISQKSQKNLFIQDSVQQDIQNNYIGSSERQQTSKFEGKIENSQSERFLSNESNLYNQIQYPESQKTYQNSDQVQKRSISGINQTEQQQSVSSMPSPNTPNNKNNFRNNQHFQKERKKWIHMIEEVITDKETKNFLTKYFSQNDNYGEKDIYFIYFLESLSNEYGNQIEFSEDIDKFQFEEILQNKLTINDIEKISLNALQIFTKDVGLHEKIINIAQSIRSDQKQREQDSINKKIFSEINQLSKILELKSKEVTKKEKQLIERERELKQKEQNFKNILKGEFDIMIFSLDEALKERDLEVNKRATQLEKTLKSKAKIIETKSKEIKQQTVNTSSNSDILKSKISAQEKQGEFLKLKAQDLEKKFVIEQEKNIAVQQKYDNLLRKHKELERYVKELQNNMQQVLQLRLLQSQGLVVNAQLSYSDTGIESQFRYSEGSTTKHLSQQVGQNNEMPSPIRNESIDEEEFKMDEVTINEINLALNNNKGTLWNIPIEQRPNSNNKKSNTPLKKKKTSDTQQILGQAMKKKISIRSMGTNTTNDEEVKVLLNILSTIMKNIQTTLPLIINVNGKGQNELIQNFHESCLDISLAAAKNSQIDVGEFFYPCFNNLVGSLVEIIPSLLTKQYNAKHLYGIVDIMFKAISFKFRYTLHAKKNIKQMQNSIFSQEVLESTRNIIKSNQDHINEIMMNPKKPTELTFIPQTAFWKKKFKSLPNKINSNQKSNNSLSRFVGQTTQTRFQLFSNEDVQKEILQVFKQYMDHSELLLKRKILTPTIEIGKAVIIGQNQQCGTSMTFDFMDNNEANEKNSTQSKSVKFENQKYILMTRIDLSLMTLILQVINKESINALQSILLDISNENESLNDFLRFIQILGWRMIQSKEDQKLIEVCVDVLLNMSSNGSHYKKLIQDISEDTIISKLITIFDKYSNNHDISEKLSVIIQRITCHNQNLKERLTSKQISIFKNQLIQIQNTKYENEFIATNLRSIILNLS